MTNREAITLIRNEQLCIRTANDCGRDCEKCPLVKPAGDILEALELAIKALEGPHWISCDKEMPKCDIEITEDGETWYESKRVLVWAKLDQDVRDKGRPEVAMVCYYPDSNDYVWHGVYDEFYDISNSCYIEAWMPLPAAYKEGE